MGFSDRQVNALRRKLNGAFVRKRLIQGREFSYIEGWYAISEANRIFGHDGWDRETVESKCILAREARGTLHAVYIAKVRLTVRAQGAAIVREGYGTGEGQGTSLGEVHERALKMAETDATKRALATFGKPFGLALYVSGRTNVRRSKAGSAPIADDDRRRTAQQLGSNGRYFVPRRHRPVLDPEFTLAAAAATAPPTSPAEPALQIGEIEATSDHAVARDPIASNPETAEPQDQSDGAAEIALDAAQHSDSLPTTLEQSHSEGDPAAEHPTSLQHDSPSIQSPTMDALRDSVLLIERTKRRREPAHLKFVGSQPCLLCGRTPSDAHHLRFAQPRALGRKVSDEFTVPLCRVHHRQLHQSGNEAKWWAAMDRDIDPLEIAKGLWEQSRSGGGVV